jgi:hypothetical protein
MLKSPTELLLLGLLVIVVAFTLGKQAATPAPEPTQQQPIVISVPQRGERGGDDRYSRAPRPQRFWDNGPETPVRGALDPVSRYADGLSHRGSAMMDPVPTRGAPEAYQQMGVITGADGKVLPLYGRRVAPRSDYFNYYTRTDTYNPVALPITFQRRDCQDNVGCQELMTGSEVRLNPTGEVAKVMLYGFDGPRYTPDIA